METVKPPRAYQPPEPCECCGQIVNREPAPVTNPLDLLVSLQAVRACIEYFLNGFESREDDTPRKIFLDGLHRNGIPIDIKYSHRAEETKRYTVSVVDKPEILAG